MKQELEQAAEFSAFEQALSNLIGYWKDDKEKIPYKFVKKHGQHILNMAREELMKKQQFCERDYLKGFNAAIERIEVELQAMRKK